MNASNLPEYIATENLTLGRARRVALQPTTIAGLRVLASQMDISEAEALRYAAEVGIATMNQMGMFDA